MRQIRTDVEFNQQGLWRQRIEGTGGVILVGGQAMFGEIVEEWKEAIFTYQPVANVIDYLKRRKLKAMKTVYVRGENRLNIAPYVFAKRRFGEANQFSKFLDVILLRKLCKYSVIE